MPRRIEGAKIALLDFDLSRHRMHHGVQLTVTETDELEKMRQRFFSFFFSIFIFLFY